MTGSLSAPLTPDEAVAAIEAAAWTENTPDEAYRGAIEAITAMCEGRTSVTVNEITAVISTHIPEPQKIIHSMTIFGADWYAATAAEFARKPGAACCWTWDLFGHDLCVTAGGRTVRFEAKAPEPLRSQLLEASRQKFAEAN